MIINTNMASINAQRNLANSSSAMQKSLEKLSSGFRINRASDDAAGLAISEKMRGQIRGIGQAKRNAQDGISLLQTAEGALNQTHAILQRMRELSVQAANDSLSEDDRTSISTEMSQLTDEIDRIKDSTKFNGANLINGDIDAKKIQIGADQDSSNDQTLEITIDSMGASDLTVDGLDVSDNSGAGDAITAIDEAIQTVSNMRASIGAWQNRLENNISNLTAAAENITSAESRIRDVDMAEEMSKFTRNQVLNQAGVAMLAQANQTPQAILKLLG